MVETEKGRDTDKKVIILVGDDYFEFVALDNKIST